MARQHGFALAAAVGLWLTGCAAIDGVAAPADPRLVRLAESLDRDDWRIDPNWTPDGDAARFRWRFGETPPEGTDTDRLLALSRRSDRVGRNAAILLAHRDPAAALPVAEVLARIVTREPPSEQSSGSAARFLDHLTAAERDEKREAIPEDTCAAAAEAWCRMLAAGGGSIEERLAEPGRLWRRSDLPVAVRAELVRGLARHLPPERIVGYEELFPGDATAVSVELRRAGIDGCLLFAALHPDRSFDADDWPAGIENAAFDPDADVRSGYGRWLAVARHPDAVERLQSQLRDADPDVARSAIRSLGLTKTEAAREALRRVVGRPAEMPRAAAAEALAAWGPEEVKPFLADESSHVRRAAVGSLAGHPSPEAAVLIDDALSDTDLDVQQRAIAATADWPDEFALPVLLAGLQNAAVRTRRECLDELRRRTGFEEPFPVAADRPERVEAVRKLAAEHDWPFDGMTRFRLAVTDRVEAAPEPPPDVAAVLERLGNPALDAAAREPLFESLREAGPSATAAVEDFCLRTPGPVAEALLAKVLPAISPAHAALAELASTEVSVRRHGAGELARLGRTATLSPLVLKRLHELLTREQDGLVWRQVMAAVADDATPDAERIALLALNNTWPDVRRLGCDYVGRHRRSHQAVWLLPLLSDGNDAVRLAAIEAAGRCGNPALVGAAGDGPPTGLHAAAVDPDRVVQFAALTALARLGDESGSIALLRWAEYESASERARAVRAIAETGRRRFEPDLARLAWTERDPIVRRELLAALESLVPAGQRPEGTDVASSEDRLAAWASRWAAGAGSSTMSPR